MNIEKNKFIPFENGSGVLLLECNGSEIRLSSAVFNCQITVLAGIEKLVSYAKSRKEFEDALTDILKFAEQHYLKKKLILFEISDVLYKDTFKVLFEGNVHSYFPYVSTNGNNRALVLYKTTHLKYYVL